MFIPSTWAVLTAFCNKFKETISPPTSSSCPPRIFCVEARISKSGTSDLRIHLFFTSHFSLATTNFSLLFWMQCHTNAQIRGPFWLGSYTAARCGKRKRKHLSVWSEGNHWEDSYQMEKEGFYRKAHYSFSCGATTFSSSTLQKPTVFTK